MTIPTPPPQGNGQRNAILAAAVALLVVALVAVGLIVTSSDDEPALVTAGEIFLQPAADAGPDPFFDDADALVPGGEAPRPSASGDTPATTVDPDTSIATTATDGTSPGLYGGTRDNAVCDPGAIVSFLDGAPDKADAWARAQGIGVDDIESFIAGLTPVTLLTDTRVTNHGFRNGSANPFQAVLQAGTAVLVDDTGVPRARCSCGNPLLAPVAQTSSTAYVGDEWAGFEPEQVTVISPGEPVVQLVLVDLTSGEEFARPVGSSGAVDVAVSNPTTTAPTTTAAPSADPTTTTTEPPTTTTTQALVPTDVTAQGRVTASSVFSADFAASLGVDGSGGSSWFSAGGGGATYTWTADAALLIEEVVIVGNGGHANPDFRTGFGFEAVTIEYWFGGQLVGSSEHGMGGTPDPTVTATPGRIIADEIRLVFSGGEDPTCGGFAELSILAAL